MKKLLLFALIPGITFANDVDIYVKSYAHQFYSLKRQAIETKAEHDIEIINHTNEPKSYSYLYQYCADEIECINAESTVTVNPHGKWNNHHDSILWVNYFDAGYYRLTAKTIVNSHVDHQQSTAFGTVTVR